MYIRNPTKKNMYQVISKKLKNDLKLKLILIIRPTKSNRKSTKIILNKEMQLNQFTFNW